MSQSPSTKRKITALNETVEHPAKRKIKSCETCRRLKTRCEVGNGSGSCHRCGALKLECSLGGSDTLLNNGTETFPLSRGVPHHAPEQSSDLDKRVLALESSLAQMKTCLEELLRSKNHATSSHEIATNFKLSEIHKPSGAIIMNRIQANGPLVADRNSRTAPASLIRDMKHYILGDERESRESDASEDVVTKGIITDDMAHSLLIGFSKLSHRWLFVRCSPSELRKAPSLLRASCVLAGLQIDSSLHGSQLHQDLYQHVSGLLSKTMLASPLSLEAIQSMLIYSMWNPVPDNHKEHLDPWLLSGVAGMQGMLAINFEQLLNARADGLVDPRSMETFRTWNLICLCHLQFSVGTGRPPVLSRQYLKQCKNILNLSSYTPRDRLVAEGVDLYDSLCNLVNSDNVQTDSLVWQEINDWKKRCGHFFELDSTKPLRFAYSCSYLILTRRTLKYLAEQPAKDQNKNATDTDLDPSLYIQLAIEHAHRILHLFLAMSDLTAFVRPAYENLLCSFAMVTLSEFAIYLDDIDATLALMERTSQHVQLGGKAEPVSKWALSVMRKYVSDNSREEDPSLVRSGTLTPRQGLGIATSTSMSTGGNLGLPSDFESSDWLAENAYQDFPSLEEMFLGG